MKALFLTLLCLPLISFAQGRGISAGLGLTTGAINLGAQYEIKNPGFDYGGYFFLQTDKEKNGAKVVYQVMSIGPQVKVHLVETHFFHAYFAPGFGLHMFKDIPDGNISKSDVTAWGPTLRIGVLAPLANGIEIGFERFEISNWFDDKPPALVPFYQATMSFPF